MSKKEGDTKLSYTPRTSVEQLVKCYSSNNTRSGERAIRRHAAEHNHMHRSTVTLHPLSVSRHSEQRLRPRTCIACRACMNSGLRSSVQSTSEVTSLLPLDQSTHLPYHSSKGDKSRQGARHVHTPAKKSFNSRKLISHQFRGEHHVQGSTSTCGSSHHSRLSESLESKGPSLPVLQTRTQSGILFKDLKSTQVSHSSHFTDTDLRKWIIQFGGDEQAAFMARGLQKLQLAYEQGKAEMGRQTKNRKRLLTEH